MNRFGPKLDGKRIGAPSTRSRPASRCARTTGRPRRSGCSSSGELTLRHPDGEDVLKPGDVVAFADGPAGAHKTSNKGSEPVADDDVVRPRTAPAFASIPTRTRSGSATGRREEHVHAPRLRPRASTTTTAKRDLEEGLALAAVGRDGVDDLAALRRGARRRSARTARPPWRGGTTPGRRPAARRRRAEQRRLHLARGLERVELAGRREHGRGSRSRPGAPEAM